ncbi:MAG: hypothetical protein QXF50_01675 [Sulfolobales archaeon]
MGSEDQKFILANLDKKEYIVGGPDLWDWISGNEGRLLIYLIARGRKRGTPLMEKEPVIAKARAVISSSRDPKLVEKAYDLIDEEEEKMLSDGFFRSIGRWAGDRIILVGESDPSGLYQKILKTFKNITREVADEYNRFVEIERLFVF